jgi:uncharacterized protein (DUF1800 family)
MDRRSFLRTTGAVAGVAALSDIKPAVAGTPSSFNDVQRTYTLTKRNRENITAALTPWSPAAGEWNVHTIGHLYHRAGFSATMAEIKAAASISPSQLVDQMLNDTWIGDSNIPAPPAHSDGWLNMWPYYGNDTSRMQQQGIDYQYANNAIRRSWGSTMAKANTMLREKMVYFWMNHFVVETQKVYFPQMMYRYLDYMRKHPWGNFKQMVRDVTVMPAMLVYLDGAQSSGRNPNENYARELMELFTLGVTNKDGEPNYTEDDIKAVASALTGFFITPTGTDPDPNVLPTAYAGNRHNNALKTVFEAPAKPYGLNSPLTTVTDDILDILFQYRGNELAYFICSELYQFFVYHEIGDAEKVVIQQLADVFKAGNWELKPVIALLLKSEHFFDDGNIGAAIKSPFELMIGTTRHLDIAVDDLTTGSMNQYGVSFLSQFLLDPPNVKGWPGYHAWISTTTLPYRIGFCTAITSTRTGFPAIGATGYGENHTGIKWTDAAVLAWAKQFANYKVDINAFIDEVAQFLCAMPPSAALQTSAIREALSMKDYEWPTMDDATRTNNIRTIVSKIVALPEYQLM